MPLTVARFGYSMFELPGMTDVEKVVINKDVVEGKSKPIYVHGDRREAPAAAKA